MRILDFVARYGVEHDVRPGTLSDYFVAAVVFVRCQRVETFTALKPSHISEHLACLQRQGYSPATIKGRRAKLLVLWRACYRLGLTDRECSGVIDGSPYVAQFWHEQMNDLCQRPEWGLVYLEREGVQLEGYDQPIAEPASSAVSP